LFKNQIIGDWGLGIGDWGLGIGDWAQSPIPNPQSPIPNPHLNKLKLYFLKMLYNFTKCYIWDSLLITNNYSIDF